MGRISISETQFAFTFFHKYLLLKKDPSLHFTFPSLRQEGTPGHAAAGADLVVNNNLFFQFKMGDFLKTRGTSEISGRKLDDNFIPYYRFHIKNANPSNQFELLKKAASDPNNIVRYISPMFHNDKRQSDDVAFNRFFMSDPKDLNDFICSINCAQFLSPDRKLSRDNSHKICYNIATSSRRRGFLFSEPKEINILNGLEEIKDGVLQFNNRAQLSISEVINSINEIFVGDNQRRYTVEDSIATIQIELVMKYDIFWIPVLETRSKRLNQRISTIIN